MREIPLFSPILQMGEKMRPRELKKTAHSHSAVQKQSWVSDADSLQRRSKDRVLVLSVTLLMNRTSVRISHFLDSNNITPHAEKRLPAYARCRQEEKNFHIWALRKLSVVLRLHLRAGSQSPPHLQSG